MKIFKYIIGISIAVVVVLIINSFNIVNPGQIGILKLFGKIDKTILLPGLHVVNPLASVDKMTSKFIQITIRSNVLTEDNLNITVETTLLYKIENFKYVYQNFSSNEACINRVLIEPSLHSAVREACSAMDWDTITSHRELLKEKMIAMLKYIIAKKGFIIANVLINDVQPPQKIKDAVMQKLKSQQEVAQMFFEKKKAKKEAEIKIIEARGIAKSQEIIQQRLTPLYVQYYAIKSYQLLANSKNKTFVLLPTSSKGSGMPMILNANN